MTGKFCDLQASSVHKENATASSFHSFAQWISTACLFCSRNWECKNKQEKCSEIQTNMMNYCGKVINRGMQQVRSTGWGSLKETMWMTSQRKVSRLGPEPWLSQGQRWGGRDFDQKKAHLRTREKFDVARTSQRWSLVRQTEEASMWI